MGESRGQKPLVTSGTRQLTFDIRPLMTSAALASTALVALLAPALVNGFPFVFADTGGYLARPFEHTLSLGRSALYGLFLVSGIRLDFWPAIIVQGLISLWLVKLVLRTHGSKGSMILYFVSAMLVLLTSLPWYAGMLMPDILVPAAALSLHLLAFAHQQLRRLELLALVLLAAFAIASHMSILALAGALLAVLVALKLLVARLALPPPRLRYPVGAISAGIALALLSNLVITGQPRLTPGGSTFFFARLLQDGIVARYLDDHCPDATVRLCSFRAEIPQDSDEWLWGNSPLGRLGGWEAFEPEARRIIIGSILSYPWLHVRTAIGATAEQFFTVATGEGFQAKDNWHAESVFKRYAPESMASFAASRQQHDAFEFRILNAIHVPVAILTAVLLPAFSVLLRNRSPHVAALAGTVFFALLANAAICGIFSNPNPRYQSRIAPLAVLTTLVIAFELVRSRAHLSSQSLP
jgi:hypothetical protein